MFIVVVIIMSYEREEGVNINDGGETIAMTWISDMNHSIYDVTIAIMTSSYSALTCVYIGFCTPIVRTQ